MVSIEKLDFKVGAESDNIVRSLQNLLYLFELAEHLGM